MTTLITFAVACLMIPALWALVLRSRVPLRVLASALAVTILARLMWFFGIYARVIPFGLENDLVIPAIPPIAAALFYAGWIIARVRAERAGRTISPAVRLRRFAPLGGAAIAAIVAAGASIRIQNSHGGWQGVHNSDAAIPLALMLIPSLLSYAKDRDAELAFLMAGIALFATVPIVIVGRLSYLFLAKVFYEVVS